MRLEKFFDPFAVFRKLILQSKKHFNQTKLKASMLLALAVGSLPQNSVALENNSIRCGPLSVRQSLRLCRNFSGSKLIVELAGFLSISSFSYDLYVFL